MAIKKDFLESFKSICPHFVPPDVEASKRPDPDEEAAVAAAAAAAAAAVAIPSSSALGTHSGAIVASRA